MPFMGSTTLVTFLLDHPHATSVELLGSWDNFTEAYSMKRDNRKGRGSWTGCHTFRDIICDGETINAHDKRDGGLKMGGTYWYFYRVDHDEEYRNPSEPSTSLCPLMPGQDLNVLEVPCDTEGLVSNGQSSSASVSNTVQTLNPDDRYVTPQPVPRSKLLSLVKTADIAHALSGASSRSAARSRPCSAVTRGSERWMTGVRSSHREVKSATFSPSSTLKSTLLHLTGPASAFTSSQGGKVRGKILRGNHEKCGRTESLNLRELKRRISKQTIMPSGSDASLESTIEMMRSRPSLLFLKKRSRPPHLSVQRSPKTDQPMAFSDCYPEAPYAPIRGTAMVDKDNRRVDRVLHQSGFSFKNCIKRRSTSLSHTRASSPLRTMVTSREQATVFDSPQLAKDIPEMQEEDVV